MAKAGTTKSIIRKRRSPRSASILVWLRRFGLGLLALFAFLWLAGWFFLSHSDAKLAEWMRDKWLSASADAGFKVSDILVEGRVYTNPDILLGIINTQKGDPILGFNPAQAAKQIEQIKWVKSVRVERRLPGVIYIGLTEKKPLALYNDGKHVFLIDEKGEVLTDEHLERFKDLILVSGQGGAQKAGELLALLSAEPEIAHRVQSAAYIGERRWDVRLKNGTILKLPEERIGLALARLSKQDKTEGLLAHVLKQIDLRDPVRIIVQTKPGTVREYQDQSSPAP